MIQYKQLRAFSFRHPKSPASKTVLDRKHIYILPTRNGILFAGILLIMLVGSINYNNSLGYLFTFLLASMTMVSILHTHRNLLGLQVEIGKVSPTFVGEKARFQVWLDNREQPARHALFWHHHPQHNNQESIIVNVPMYQRVDFTIEVLAQQRGYLPLGQLVVYTRFPLDLFRAWAYIHLDFTALIYPAPSGKTHWRLGQHSEENREGKAQVESGEDFIGYRTYQIGDSPRHIDWKAVAREQDWLIKQFGGMGSTTTVWFNWADVKHLPNTEVALSQLCLWILNANKAGIQYGLKLPDQSFEPANGEQHQAHCLKALALFGKS